MVKPGKRSVESSFVQWAEMTEELNIMPVGWTSMSSYMMERKGGECQDSLADVLEERSSL